MALYLVETDYKTDSGNMGRARHVVSSANEETAADEGARRTKADKRRHVLSIIGGSILEQKEGQ